MHREGFGLNLIALHYTTFHPLEVVPHCRSPQLQSVYKLLTFVECELKHIVIQQI